MNKKIGSDLTIILPCAGKNKSNKSNTPRSLIYVDEDNLIQKQIKTIKTCYPRAELICVVGFQSEKIIPFIPSDVKIVENELFEETSIVRSVALALRIASHKNILMINGDLLFNTESINNITKNKTCVVVDYTGQIKKDKVGINIIDRHAACFSYTFNKKWGQITYIEKEDHKLFYDLCCDKNKKRMLMHEILNQMIHYGRIIQCYEPKMMQIIEVHSYRDIERLKNEYMRP